MKQADLGITQAQVLLNRFDKEAENETIRKRKCVGYKKNADGVPGDGR